MITAMVLAWAAGWQAGPPRGPVREAVSPEPESPEPGPTESAPSTHELIGRLRAEAVLADLRWIHERAQSGALRVELARITERSVNREWELVQRQRLLTSSAAGGKAQSGSAARPGHSELAAGLAEILADVTSDAAPAVESPAEAATRERQARATELAEQLRRSLNGLLRAEGIYQLELLEAGLPALFDESLAPERRFGCGPVVFRRLDGSGHPVGSLLAEHLTLEGSRAGRTLTLVLQGAQERFAGSITPQPSDPLRIDFSGIDGAPFRELCAELFAPETAADLRVTPLAQRAELLVRFSELLGATRAGRRYELQSVGGRDAEGWRDVRFLMRDSRGAPLRHLVADRMHFGLRDGLVVIELLDGASLTEDRRVPFLDGRLRIVLADADPELWISAGLPGFRQLEPEADDAGA